MYRILPIVVLMLIATAATAAKPAAAQPALQVTASTDRVAYPTGVPVRVTVTVRNTGDAPLRLTFPSSQSYDFNISSAQSLATVWQWSQNRGFAAVIVERTLAAGESVSYAETWNQRSPGGDPAPTGIYRLTGMLTTMTRVTADPVLFVIGDEQPLPGPGCQSLISRYPNGTPSELLIGSISPPDTLLAVWKQSGATWSGWSRVPGAPNDLGTINFGDQLRVCLSGPARWIVPV